MASAGTKLNKQNVFDDFIAAAEWLIENKYTNTSKLAIQGGSNGGLLVGACMTQRPDLFAACLPAVGVMDMLRFHKFTAGRFWVDDYGSADDPDEFKALLCLLAVPQPEAGTSYPATLVTTADTDDRVVPGHSFKFAAQLQESQRGDAPVLIRIETRAGSRSWKTDSEDHRRDRGSMGVPGQESGYDVGGASAVSRLRNWVGPKRLYDTASTRDCAAKAAHFDTAWTRCRTTFRTTLQPKS